MKPGTILTGTAVFLSAILQLRADEARMITPGSSYASAAETLAMHGAAGEERHYSTRENPDLETRYHPLRKGLDLVATMEKSTGKISYLRLMTTPAHRPVKGLEVSIPVTSFAFSADGSMQVSIPPESGDRDTIPAAEAPLPVNVFKRLQASEKQTVVVYGTSLSINGAWAKALREYFDKEFPGQVTFANAAQAGMHSNWGVANLQKRVLDRKPDLVFIEFSANDAATKHKISREKSRANLDAMVKSLRGQNPQVDIVLQTMNPAWDSPSNPAKKYATDRPELESYYDVYRSYAKENGLPLADHFPAWAKMMKDDRERFEKSVADGIHPQAEPSLAVTWPTVHALLEQARAKAKAEDK
ncbi:SGNH/GDSL hydrolase family protein [Luteolibacter flavescens]|uniref:SGNH/GDSL hydrolase family protein n=1 Tax=Luteolibacter flavescens TaxID=1859460 RepID=A0ABT3FPM2_9BACT|nr:SGNH/GDSL hydrolase family protein [Luteolibacter flavescens]MCW1884935.1 SGNH/GDSL hydrolase family protein [Luteolibacter flavescens]